MEEKILEFIKRRFPSEDRWMSGNCWWFATILAGFANADRYKLEVVYDPINGHFYAYDALENVYYDWQGAHRIIQDSEFVSMEWLKEHDTAWLQRLLRDCIL